MSAFLRRTSLRFLSTCNHSNDATFGYSYTRILCLLKRWQSDARNTNTTKTAAAVEDEEYDDKPIKYTASDAHKKWKSAYNFRIPEEAFPYPSYQWPVIVLSCLALLIYFGALREENDIDENLSKPLFERFPELEKPMLQNSITTNKKLGRDTSAMEKRLNEITQKS